MTALRFLHSEIEQPDPKKAFFHILPVSLERTVSFGKGTGKAPATILEVSGQLECFDLSVGTPAKSGIFTHPLIFHGNDLQNTLSELTQKTARIFSSKSMPITIGGEHTVTYGVIMGIKENEKTFGVVNFDAHADLREEYENDRFSHACVMKRIFSEGIPVAQVANRTICKEEFDFIHKQKIPFYPAKEICKNQVSLISLPENFPLNIYISIDVDGFDPSILPTTGTPVPGGMLYYQFFSLVESVLKGRRLIGFDLVEHAPSPGAHSADYFCADIIYKMAGIARKNRAGQNSA